MTLRLRLVLALLALTTVGLGFFGLTTYRLYGNSQYAQLDQDLRESATRFTGILDSDGATFLPPGLSTQTPERPDRGPGDPSGFPWAALVDRDGTVLVELFGSVLNTGPDLSAGVSADPPFQTIDGWRVYITPARRTSGAFVVTAKSLDNVTEALNRLVLIEATAAVGLLILLGTGSWFILRRGLHPLERMAVSARSITAGDLSDPSALRRVEPSEPKTEVGQLGLALNTMLDEIEEAFRERDRTEQRLRQFLADASHELRTPLTSIQGFAELFRVGGEQNHVDLEIILRRIEEESARMKHLVEDLLLLARLDETRPAERAPVDLTILAADACSDAVATSPGRRITLDAPEPVVVLGDQDHLRQAMANLMTNAVRHTPDGSPVEVRTGLDGGVATVSVRDHGPGLDEEALAHVFDRFWQADSARVGSGAGLGLAIVAGIATEHRGTIDVVNMDDGGACFTLRLPLNAPVP